MFAEKITIRMSYVLMVSGMIILEVIGFFNLTEERWGLVLLLPFILGYIVHEFVHAILAKYFGFTVKEIELGVHRCVCKIEADGDLTKLPLVIISGTLFQVVITVPVIVFLTLQSGLFPTILAGGFAWAFISDDILNKECDFNRVYRAAASGTSIADNGRISE